MSERDNLLLIQDMLVAIEKILAYTANMTFADYEFDSKTRDAVERNFGIIGEAGARITVELKLAYPQVEWRIIKDFRNVVIHQYFGVNNQIVWDIIVSQIPLLHQEILAIVNALRK